MRTLFMGTPDFAVPCLKSLIDAGHEVCGVFTQPDKPKGRGYTLTPPPVKVLAQESGIPVYQPKTLKDGEALTIVKELSPEVIVVVAYGKILPKEIIEYPAFGCINVHASLLPRYRGAAPIQWCVLNGEKETGVTTMFMDVGLDTGDMLLKAATPIGDNETAGELHDRLSKLGAELIVETLTKLQSGALIREKQKDGDSCYAPMLTKELSRIDWNKPAQSVHNQIRGLSPWPTAQTRLCGKVLKIHASRLSDKASGGPGEIVSLEPLVVACGENTALELLQVQFEGKKRMAAADFLRGHRLEKGARLG